MLRIRRFEERAVELYRDGEIPGFVHISIGQEATAVGATWSLREDDVITSTHRGHGHCLAKGMDPGAMLAELMGRDAGTCRGRGGSMHIADPAAGVFGANGIVGGGLPIAVGAATAIRLRESDSVVLAFFGDGAVAQGTFHESVNLAAVWNLPVVFLCENNHYAEFSAFADQHRSTLAQRATSYGVGYQRVDGNDVVAVAEALDAVVRDIRAGGGPVLVESETYRWRGHYEGDPERYRAKEEVELWKGRDPLKLCESRLTSLGVDVNVLGQLDRETSAQIADCVEQARAAKYPDPDRLMDFVYAPCRSTPEPSADAFQPVGEFKLARAVRRAIEVEMRADSRVFMAGIDIAAGGNIFGLFRNMVGEFGCRIRDAPVSESAIVGTAVGEAMAGMKPVVEIMYLDFIGVCFDQIMNQAAKLRYMTAGRAAMSLVIRTQFGAGRSSGAQHSQSLEALLSHIPGLKVVMPATPAEAYGLMRAAIQDPNPVIFIENRLTYGMTGPQPPDSYVLPIGTARIVRRGADVTLVSYSRMLGDAEAAADELGNRGIDVEVIDLRTVAPIDEATVLASLAKTNRLVVAHEGVERHGLGAELAAMAVNEGFWHLDAPVVRVGAPFASVPYSPRLEQSWLPDKKRIVRAVQSVMEA
jgi:2-oxoisovalerate dehydrogenase E1 component